MVVVEGENADGVIVDQDHFDISGDGPSSPISADARQFTPVMPASEESATQVVADPVVTSR